MPADSGREIWNANGFHRERKLQQDFLPRPQNFTGLLVSLGYRGITLVSSKCLKFSTLSSSSASKTKTAWMTDEVHAAPSHLLSLPLTDSGPVNKPPVRFGSKERSPRAGRTPLTVTGARAPPVPVYQKQEPPDGEAGRQQEEERQKERQADGDGEDARDRRAEDPPDRTLLQRMVQPANRGASQVVVRHLENDRSHLSLLIIVIRWGKLSQSTSFDRKILPRHARPSFSLPVTAVLHFALPPQRRRRRSGGSIATATN